MTKKKIQTLRWFDILILTIILFGQGILSSTLQYLDMLKNPIIAYENLDFSALDNYRALGTQAFLLVLAYLYLLYRKFDFSIWTKKMRVSLWLPLQAVTLFLLTALIMDICYLLTYQLALPSIPSLSGIFSRLDLSLFLYSLLNGFYEEIFFLGICLAVKSDWQNWAFLYSLLIRFSFHTYQGLGVALGIGIFMGSLYYYLYQKMDREYLLPFFLSHSIADMLGLSILFYFWT